MSILLLFLKPQLVKISRVITTVIVILNYIILFYYPY